MNTDLLIWLSALLGLLLKRLTTPPKWKMNAQDVIEILVGAGIMLAGYWVLPAGLVPEKLADTEGKRLVTIALAGFFIGPGIVAIGRAFFYEWLPTKLRGMLPPGNGNGAVKP